MKKIQDLLEDFAKEYDLQGKDLDVKALDAFLEEQKKDISLQKLKALGVHKGVLLLYSPHSMEGFTVMMKKSALISSINKTCGQNILKDINIKTTRENI